MAREPSESIPGSDQRRTAESPIRWAQVVRGGDSDLPPITHEEHRDGNANARIVNADDGPPTPPSRVAVAQKRPAWNKPSNGVVESGSGSIMGADSWPALSESTKVSPKSLDSSLPKQPLPNGSASTSQKQGSSSYGNSSEQKSHTAVVPSPPRPKPTRRGGGGNPGVGGVPGSFTYNHNHAPSPPTPPPLPTYPMYQIPANAYRFVPPPPPPDTSPRELQYRGSYRGARPVGGFPSQGGNDRRGSNRRGNFGSHSRGDGSFHNNHGGRRDHDRGYSNARDIHGLNPRGPPRGYYGHPPSNALPFVPAPHVRPFPNPMVYPEFQYFSPFPLEPYRGMPVVPPQPPAVMMPGPEPLSASLVRQIEYYFSDENLIKDNYLRSNMDEQGWVPVSLIAGFPRVRKLMEDISQNSNSIDNIQYILDCLKPSTIVEVEDCKLRRRNEWMKWANTSSVLPSDTGLNSSDEYNCSMLEESLKNMSVGEASTSPTGNSDTSSGALAAGCITESSGRSSLPNGEHIKETVPSLD